MPLAAPVTTATRPVDIKLFFAAGTRGEYQRSWLSPDVVPLLVRECGNSQPDEERRSADEGQPRHLRRPLAKCNEARYDIDRVDCNTDLQRSPPNLGVRVPHRLTEGKVSDREQPRDHRGARAAALAAAIDDGLSQLTFGRLAKRLDVNDRIIVYHLPSKDELIAEVLLTMGGRLQEVLARAFTTTASDHVQLAKAAWPVLARPEIDPIFSPFFETIDLAAAGREPYKTLAAQLIDAWTKWLASFFRGTAKQRRAEAETAVAVLDGLLLMRQVSGPAAANRAAARLGIR